MNNCNANVENDSHAFVIIVPSASRLEKERKRKKRKTGVLDDDIISVRVIPLPGAIFLKMTILMIMISIQILLIN